MNYSQAKAQCKPCDCGSTNIAGPPHQAIFSCYDCGRQGKPALRLDWAKAAENWNTWPKTNPSRTLRKE